MTNIKSLPRELQLIAETELGEVPARIPEELQALKGWIAQQPHLNARTDDQFLIQFLRGCKYSLEKAKVFVHDHEYANSENSIPMKYLPTYLGGENGSTEEHLKNFENKWLKYENYFKENAHYGSNELLRLGQPLDFDGIYGLGGSFRTLDVD